MPILVNGELIGKELIREESQRVGQAPDWLTVPESLEKRIRLQQVAEEYAIDRVLLRQAAEKDTRPVDPEILEAEVQRLRDANGCRVVFDDAPLRRQIEQDLRLRRAMHDLLGSVPPPSEEDILRFYKTERKNFLRPETVHAAHIVKHVDETHPEEEARAGIEAALSELRNGEPFAEVAERHSDCKGNGGDLGAFPRGKMVPEFEDVVFAFQPGQRSSIFRTPFGFHIAEVRSRTPPGVADLAAVRGKIEQFLAATNQANALRRATAALRAKADVRRISARAAQEIDSSGVVG